MKKKIIDMIVKETIDNVVSNVIKENSEYKLQDLDELYNYMWLKSDVTHINIDIFVDDGEAYVKDEHIPLLFVRNGQGRKITEFIPISISENPRILDNDIVININKNIIIQVFDFIKVNLETLMLMANGKIGANEFVETLKIPSYAVTEEKHMINELANNEIDYRTEFLPNMIKG